MVEGNNIVKKLILFLLMITILSIYNINSANATTLTFDDLSIGQISGSYGGFNWINMYVKNQPVNAVSGTQVAYDKWGLPAAVTRNELFTFDSAYLSAFNNENLEVKVLGFNVNLSSDLSTLISSATPIYSTTITLNSDVPTLYNFNYKDINVLAFVTLDANHNPVISPGNNRFAMDNFTFNSAPTPEPSTMLLGLLGLGGLLNTRKRK